MEIKVLKKADQAYPLMVAAYSPNKAGMTEAGMQANMNLDRSQYFAAFDGDVMLGFIGFTLIFDQADLTNVAVHPNYQGKGIGQKLLELALAWLEEQGATSLFLEVRADNLSAINFYKKNHFKEYNRRPSYYQNPPMDAVLMVYQFGGEHHGENFSN